MGHTTVRIRTSTHQALKTMADESGQTMQSLIEEALELLRRRRFLDAVNASYSALKEDNSGWLELREELAEWDVALEDGLDEATDK